MNSKTIKQNSMHKGTAFYDKNFCLQIQENTNFPLCVSLWKMKFCITHNCTFVVFLRQYRVQLSNRVDLGVNGSEWQQAHQIYRLKGKSVLKKKNYVYHRRAKIAPDPNLLFGLIIFQSWLRLLVIHFNKVIVIKIFYFTLKPVSQVILQLVLSYTHYLL